MLPENVRLYIDSYFLRSHEEIDIYGFKDMGDGLLEIPIVKRTAKRRKKTREILLNLKCSMGSSELLDISKTFTSPGVKRNWSSEKGDPYFHSGTLMKIINYESDEKSVKDIAYVMGAVLFEFIEKKEQDEREKRDNELSRLREKFEKLNPIPIAANIPLDRMLYISKICDLFNDLISNAQGHFQEKFTTHWRQGKRTLFLHFLLAFYMQMKTKLQFDWKEIGADYYSEIGGSKRFDGAKKEFISILEELDFPPISISGLLSLGSIVFIPFSGPLNGSMCEYRFGTVHSVTDHAVFSDVFSTTARNLWLVENRGVVTRFSYEKDFLKNTNSLVIGVEGQLKSSVKRFIRMVYQSASIEQVLIWMDYDEAGVVIADTIYQVLMEENNQVRTIKWIVPDQKRVVNDVQSYHQIMNDYLQKKSGEQEERMEGVKEWLKWMEN
ncbi:hypothetical protein ABE288_27745 [Bacillus salipaludis]|uniref:hypothetical protein n=1 Tax=Bacillus salipaludis TaxID=2547811 RepID=UPI003D19FEB8